MYEPETASDFISTITASVYEAVACQNGRTISLVDLHTYYSEEL